MRGIELHRRTTRGSHKMSLGRQWEHCPFFPPPTTYLPSLLNPSALYCFTFCFRNHLRPHFILTCQGLEKPSSDVLPPSSPSQHRPYSRQHHHLHTCLHYHPQHIKIHRMEELYLMKKDPVQIQKWEKYRDQFFLVHSLLCQCRTPNLWKFSNLTWDKGLRKAAS